MTTDLRICFFGDSFVHGTGDDDALGWVGRISAAMRRGGAPLTSYNLGVRRETSLDIRLRWRAEANVRLSPEADGRLVFSFGANDTAAMSLTQSRLSMEESVTHAGAILTEAARWKPTLLIAPLPVMPDLAHSARISALARAFAYMAGSVGAHFLDLGEAVSAFLPFWRVEAAAGDGVHPNRGAYSALAEAIQTAPAWRAFLDAPPPG